MTVHDLLTRMSSREIAEWCAYFQMKRLQEQQTMQTNNPATRFRGQVLPGMDA
jgi:hypothetical protein